MVEVRFACIPGVSGVKCVLDGVTKYSDSTGIASFFGISQGAHSYSVEAPDGMVFVSGEDYFGRPLYESGTTTIEWVPIPGYPWPEANPWMMMFNFEEGEEPPDMVEVRFACIPSVAGVKCTLDGVVKYSDSIGICNFYDIAIGDHSYSVEKEGWQFVSGYAPFIGSIPQSGTILIPAGWPTATPFGLEFNFTEEGEEPPDDEEPPEISDTLGKIGAVVGVLSFLGILADSARRR
ncbi:hypothetical protein ES703_02608 [subsurface metagenome]